MVISADCTSDCLRVSDGDRQFKSNIRAGDQVKYDFTEDMVYIRHGGVLSAVDFRTFRLQKQYLLPNVTDFYVSKGRIFYARDSNFYCLIDTFLETEHIFLRRINGSRLIDYYIARSGVALLSINIGLLLGSICLFTKR